MADYLNITCAKCGRRPEEILILTCDHNLCLTCAARNLRQDSTRQSKHTVHCDICGAATLIDQSSLRELYRLTPEESVLQPSPSDLRFTPEAFTPFPVQSKMCVDHPDEQLSYFCLDCEKQCICAECCIHGVHKSHEVMNIKKAHPIYKGKVEEMYMHLSSLNEGINNKSQRQNSKIKELADSVKQGKSIIKRSLDEIRMHIERKEKEVIEYNERVAQDQIKEIDSHTKMLQSKATYVKSLIKQIQQINNYSNQIELINFYAENHQQILNNYELDVPRSTELVSGYKCFVLGGEEFTEKQNAIYKSIMALRGLENR